MNFSNFRILMNKWDNIKEDFEKNCIIEDNNLVFFFKKEGKLYGAPEQSRLTFAKMKNPNEDEKEFCADATFKGFELNSEEKKELIFTYKDLDKIEVVDKSEIKNEPSF